MEVDGRVQVARAPSLPGPNCVGGRESWSTMQMILDSLATADRFEALPLAAGPLALLSERRQVPAGVENPVSWVATHVLPQKLQREQDTKEIAHRTHRDTLGFRFFEQWHVALFVKKRFRPDAAIPGTPPKAARDISHFVRGKNELLLMEPVVGTRQSLTDDLRAISESFLAWKQLFQQSRVSTTLHPRFIAYVITNGYMGAVGDAHALLAKSADQVINVDDPPQRTQFLQTITAIGRSGGEPGTLPLH